MTTPPHQPACAAEATPTPISDAARARPRAPAPRERFVRAVRVGVDVVSIALLAFAWWREAPLTGVLTFWLLSLGIFPPARHAERVARQHWLHWLWLALGSALMLLGAHWWLDARRHGLTPQPTLVLLGAALALAGAAYRVTPEPRPDSAPATPRVLLGLAAHGVAAASMFLGLVRGGSY